MICFKKIKWRNLLSTGNQWTEIDLNKKSNTVIIGTNGAGKSTMLDALTFVLFNKPFRKINKSQLVNATNEKDCVVELDFTIGSIDWFIRRGIKPNIFEIHFPKSLTITLKLLSFLPSKIYFGLVGKLTKYQKK